MGRPQIEDMVGQVFDSVLKSEDDDELHFINSSHFYVFYHDQDCCESVWIESIDGDLADLQAEPLLMAEEVIHYGETDDYESCTYTFYKFATIKGSVTVRWNGVSNGYYSESVDFCDRKRGATQ